MSSEKWKTTDLIEEMVEKTFDEVGISTDFDKDNENILKFESSKIGHDTDLALEEILTNVTSFNGSYVQKIKCFRFAIEGEIIDIPANWSLFHSIKQDWDKSEYSFHALKRDFDYDYLFDVFATLIPNLESLVLLNVDQSIQLVMFKEGQLEKYEELKTYFENLAIEVQAQNLEKVAA